MVPAYTKAVQYSIESDVDTMLGYNDNIFLSSNEHDSVYKLLIAPSARLTAKERNWDTYVNASLNSNKYSDHNLDSNDIFLDASGNYKKERDIFTLKTDYNKDSNLNAKSSDFGITGKRVNHRLFAISPQYTRLLTERLVFSASYNYTDVEYDDIANTGYVPYNLETLTGSISYSLGERDRLSLILQASDYSSKDNSVVYKLYNSRIAIEHQFTETWKADLKIGGSRRNTTNRITQTFDFFGQPIQQTQEIDFTDRGTVFDAGVEKQYETGSLTARISRDDVTNSYGGLNQVDSFRLALTGKISEQWRYSILTRYENIDSVSGAQRLTDRKSFFFEPVLYYAVDRNWTVNASYHYIQRKFKSDTSDKTPDSNQIYIGLTYNFPEISTY